MLVLVTDALLRPCRRLVDPRPKTGSQKVDQGVVDLLPYRWDTQGSDLAPQIVGARPQIAEHREVLAKEAKRQSMNERVVDAMENLLEVMLFRRRHSHPGVVVLHESNEDTTTVENLQDVT